MSLKVLLPAGLLLLGGCSWFDQGNRELTVELAKAPPKPGYQLGGSIDSLEIDSGKGLLTVRGWHMLTPETTRPSSRASETAAPSGVIIMQVLKKRASRRCSRSSASLLP